MLYYIFAVLCLAAYCSADLLTESQYQALFADYTNQYHKLYEAQTLTQKFTVFKKNVDIIIQHNASPDHTYTLAVNQFADWTQEEYKTRLLGFRSEAAPGNATELELERIERVSAGAALDWRQQSFTVVPPIKNQGQCGSCWAFSTAFTAEAAWAIKTKQILDISEQQLVDCAGAYGNQGCNGGMMDYSFSYMIANGMCTESSYPYRGYQTRCRACSTVLSVQSYVDVPSNENSMLKAANINPLSIAIDASGYYFQFYNSGVFNGPCNRDLDHAVAIIGYGTDPRGGDYWIVRNSWGASWGEGGYIRMARNRNLCGLATYVSFPVV